MGMLGWIRGWRDPQASTPLDEARFVVLDLETTGLDVARDRMISAAAVAVSGWSICLEEVLELHIRPEVPISPASIPIHGLLPSDVEGGVSEREAVEQIDAFIGPDVIVGHHIRFDLGILDRARARPRRRAFVDTGRLAIRLEHGPTPGYVEVKPPSLDALARDLGVCVQSRHTASGDVLATAEIFLAQLARAKAKGIRTVGDLTRRGNSGG